MAEGDTLKLILNSVTVSFAATAKGPLLRSTESATTKSLVNTPNANAKSSIKVTDVGLVIENPVPASGS